MNANIKTFVNSNNALYLREYSYENITIFDKFCEERDRDFKARTAVVVRRGDETETALVEFVQCRFP